MATTTPQRLNPATLPDAGQIGYSQISVADKAGLAFVSGQVAWPQDGSPPPTDLAAQTDLVLAHLQAALSALDATPDDIVQMRIYLCDLTQDRQRTLMEPLLQFLDGAKPSLTGIGVCALAAPELQVEIEMVVQVPSIGSAA